MANITAAEVNKLRKMTGSGMMDCKKALIESDGDFDLAIEILRKKGQKIAAKRADKEASEGLVISRATEDHTFGVIVMVSCETDFVAKGDDFTSYVNQVVELALSNKPNSLDAFKSMELNGRSVEENLSDMIGRSGEKMEIAHYEFIEAPHVAAYNHHGNRLATLLGMNKGGVEGLAQAAQEVAMQVAAMNPVAVDKDDVDPKIVEKEIEIGKEQAREEGKPEQILEKIALGKLNKFFKENTLINQDFVRDTKKTVGQYLQEFDKELTVTSFFRFMLGA